MKAVLRIVGLLGAALLLSSCGDSTTNPGTGGALELNSGAKGTGDTYSHAFGTAGTFNYHCAIHPSCSGLMGTVTVVAAGVAIPSGSHQLSVSLTDGGSIDCSYTLTFPATTVHVGETVQWNFVSRVDHTVTSN